MALCWTSQNCRVMGPSKKGMLLLFWSFLRLHVVWQVREKCCCHIQRRQKCWCLFEINFGDTLFRIQGRYSSWKESFVINLFLQRVVFEQCYNIRNIPQLRKYQKMFGNNRREFIISLPENPKCKSDQLSLSLLKNGLSLSQFFLTLLLIVGTL